MKYSIDNFLSDARKIHGNKYDYSKVLYINAHTKVCIICPIHGEFWMTPNKHLHCKQGCPKCAGKHKTTEELIEEFREIHGNKYIYTEVEYTRAIDKVCIICPKHGPFWQSPNKHLQGRGCPYCNNSHLEDKIKKFLEENKIKHVPQKEFDWLVYKGKMKLDFYLPEYNVAIECQGEQHFHPSFPRNNISIAHQIFEKTRQRDIVKYNLCKENKVKLLYFSNLTKEKELFGESIYHKTNDILNKILEK